MTKEESESKIYYDDWLDAHKQHLATPDTFHWELYTINKGDYIKINDGKERFWCTVIDILSDDKIIAKVENLLYFDYAYNLNDKVGNITTDHIYDHRPAGYKASFSEMMFGVK